MGFSLQQPYSHIMRLGEHLREAGEQVYQGYAMPSVLGRELHSVLAGMAE